MRTRLLIPAAALLILPACGGTGDDPSPAPPPAVDHGRILPLASGNRWYYRESLFDSSGVLIGFTRDTLRFVRDTIIGGTRWFADRQGILYGVKNGIAVRNMFPSDTTDHLYLLYPVRNARFEYDGPGGYRITSLGLGTTATITAPAGVFECLIYFLRSPVGETHTLYAAPDVGIVRIEASRSIRELEGFFFPP